MAKGSNNTDVLAREFYEKVVSASEQQQDEIRLAAYYLWESKGRNNGSDVEDWIEAVELVSD
jgi:hypothetical protein